MSITQPSRIGSYQILGFLGKGAFGRVWKARDDRTQETVALKVSHSSVPQSIELERFRSGAAALAELNDPSIVRYREMFEWESHLVLVMDYISDSDLSQMIERMKGDAAKVLATSRGVRLVSASNDGRPCVAVSSRARGIALDSTYVRLVAEWGTRIADALAAAHAKEIIHRDVKPANVLLCRTGLPVLGDFDLAHRIRDPNGTNLAGLMGTMNYMSPEQLRRDEVCSFESDVYSLGVVMYELLCARYPFEPQRRSPAPDVNAQNDIDRTRDADEESPPIARHVSGVPRALRTIVETALRKRKAERYATAAALAADLRQYLDGKPIVARPQPVLQRAWRSARTPRNRRTASVAVLSFACLAVLGGVVWRRSAVAKAIAEADTSRAREETRMARDRNAASSLALGARTIGKGEFAELGFRDVFTGLAGLSAGAADQRELLALAKLLRRRGLQPAAQPLIETLEAMGIEDPLQADVLEERARLAFHALRLEEAARLLSAAMSHMNDDPARRRAAGDTLRIVEALAGTRVLWHEPTPPGETAARTIIVAPIDRSAAHGGAIFGVERDRAGVQTPILWRTESGMGGSARQVRPNAGAGLGSAPVTLLHSHPGPDEHHAWILVGSADGEEPRSRLTAWILDRRNAEMRPTWTTTIPGGLSRVKTGNLDGDPDPEIAVVGGLNARDLLVLDDLSESEPVAIPVPFRHHDSEDVGDVAIGDVDGIAGNELAVVTNGHHEFAASLFALRDGRAARVCEPLRAGVLSSCVIIPDAKDGPSLLISRAFTPGRDDLEDVLHPAFDSPGLFRCRLASGAFAVEKIYEVDDDLGWWAAPRQSQRGRSSSGEPFLAFQLEWRAEVPLYAHVQDRSLAVLPLGDRDGDPWMLPSFTSAMVCDFDLDEPSELLLFDHSRVLACGIEGDHDPSGEDARAVPGDSARAAAAGQLARLARAISLGDVEAESLAIGAAARLAAAGRFEFARDALEEWYGERSAKEPAILHALGDLDLLAGEYGAARTRYSESAALGRESDSTALLASSGLTFAQATDLAGLLNSDSEVAFADRFDGPESAIRLAPTDGADGFEIREDESGWFGGRYGRGHCARVFLRAEWPRASHSDRGLVRRTLRSSVPVWTGQEPVVIRFLLYVEKLAYASRLEVRLVPCDPLVGRPGQDTVACPPIVRFEHTRNSREQEGDRYRLMWWAAEDSPLAYSTGNLMAEFPTEHWLHVEISLVPALSTAHVEIRHVDRRFTEPVVARIHAGGFPRTGFGACALEFASSISVGGDDWHGEFVSILLDEVEVLRPTGATRNK